MAQPRHMLDRALSALPDWLFLASGLTILALALVTPNWLGCLGLARQRDLMREQVARLEGQEARYRAFYDALVADDPVLLERLAFTQLGLKPVGKEVLDRPDLTNGLDDTEAQRRADLLATSASIDKWLLEPLPQAGVDTPLYQPADSRLVRLTTAPLMRGGLFLAAIACLAAGLWPSTPKPDEAEDAAEPRRAASAG